MVVTALALEYINKQRKIAQQYMLMDQNMLHRKPEQE